MNFNEGELFATTRVIDLRPHGYIPPRTMLRVKDVQAWCDTVVCEFVHGTPADLEDWSGGVELRDDELNKLARVEAPVSVLSRARTAGKRWSRVAGWLLLIFTCSSEINDIFTKMAPNKAQAAHNSGLQPYGWHERWVPLNLDQSSVCVWAWSADYFEQCKRSRE